MHNFSKRNVLSIILGCALTACGGGGGGTDAKAQHDISTDPIPVIIEDPAGVKVTTTSLPERTGDYRGEADRTWAVLEQAGVKAVSFTTDTRFTFSAAARQTDPSDIPVYQWGGGYILEHGLEPNPYVDKTYIARQKRRFLYYKPTREAPSGKYPLMIVVHGQNVSPEFERHANTMGRMDELAERDGFVVVYANGQQSQGETRSDAFYTNLGTWQSCDKTDETYFKRIVPELTTRGIQIDPDRIYMAGTSAGGAAVFSAATMMGDTLAGIAAVTPTYNWPGSTQFALNVGDKQVATPETCGVLKQPPLSVMVIQSLRDPAFTDTGSTFTNKEYNAAGVNTRLAWRQALNIPEAITETVAIPNAVQEGNGFVGMANQTVQITRNSQATIYRYPAAPSGVTFEYIEMDHAGHGWPTPRAIDDWHGNVETFGLRNQDFDASELIWAFMKDKRRIP